MKTRHQCGYACIAVVGSGLGEMGVTQSRIKMGVTKNALNLLQFDACLDQVCCVAVA